MTTKPRGVDRGGYRPGAGRPKGSRGKHKLDELAELLPKLAEPDRQLPLYRLLDWIADESLDPKYRDVFSIAGEDDDAAFKALRDEHRTLIKLLAASLQS